MLLLRLLRLARPYWSGLARGFGLGLLVAVIGLVPPLIAKLYFDSVYPSRDFGLLRVLVFAALTIGMTSSLVATLRNYYTNVVGVRLSSATALMYFNHLQHLPTGFFDDHRVGEVMSRLGDMRSSLGTITRIIDTVVLNGIFLLIVPPFLALLSWKLMLIALMTTPITVSLSTMSSRYIRRLMKDNAESAAELGAVQYEVLTQIRTFKSMGAESAVFQAIRERTQQVVKTQLRANGLSMAVGGLNTIVGLAGTAVYTWFAWTLILKGEISLGSFVAFSAYLAYLTGPVGQLAGLFADFQQTAVALARTFEYLDIAPEQPTQTAFATASAPTHILSGDIRFVEASLHYQSHRRVLHEVSALFPFGEVTAVVGSSGAGKSSLLRMIARMPGPDTGTVFFGETSSADIPLHELRRQVGVVWQEPALFRGSVWENLTFGLHDVSPAAVARAMRTCQLSDVMAELAEGYETQVAELGATLSGGQRQRFAIARALLRKTPVLLLDEATSQLDVQTEEALLRAIFEEVKGTTLIFTTHRLATAALADVVCVLEHGRVAEIGSPRHLMEAGGIYAGMMRLSQVDETRRDRIRGIK